MFSILLRQVLMNVCTLVFFGCFVVLHVWVKNAYFGVNWDVFRAPDFPERVQHCLCFVAPALASVPVVVTRACEHFHFFYSLVMYDEWVSPFWSGSSWLLPLPRWVSDQVLICPSSPVFVFACEKRVLLLVIRKAKVIQLLLHCPLDPFSLPRTCFPSGSSSMPEGMGKVPWDIPVWHPSWN